MVAGSKRCTWPGLSNSATCDLAIRSTYAAVGAEETADFFAKPACLLAAGLRGWECLAATEQEEMSCIFSRRSDE